MWVVRSLRDNREREKMVSLLRLASPQQQEKRWDESLIGEPRSGACRQLSNRSVSWPSSGSSPVSIVAIVASSWRLVASATDWQKRFV